MDGELDRSVNVMLDCVHNLRAGHAVVGEQKPEAEHWLGEDVENSISNDLGVETNDAATISDTPDAGGC